MHLLAKVLSCQTVTLCISQTFLRKAAHRYIEKKKKGKASHP